MLLDFILKSGENLLSNLEILKSIEKKHVSFTLKKCKKSLEHLDELNKIEIQSKKIVYYSHTYF